MQNEQDGAEDTMQRVVALIQDEHFWNIWQFSCDQLRATTDNKPGNAHKAADRKVCGRSGIFLIRSTCFLERYVRCVNATITRKLLTRPARPPLSHEPSVVRLHRLVSATYTSAHDFLSPLDTTEYLLAHS